MGFFEKFGIRKEQEPPKTMEEIVKEKAMFMHEGGMLKNKDYDEMTKAGYDHFHRKEGEEDLLLKYGKEIIEEEKRVDSPAEKMIMG